MKKNKRSVKKSKPAQESILAPFMAMLSKEHQKELEARIKVETDKGLSELTAIRKILASCFKCDENTVNLFSAQAKRLKNARRRGDRAISKSRSLKSDESAPNPTAYSPFLHAVAKDYSELIAAKVKKEMENGYAELAALERVLSERIKDHRQSMMPFGGDPVAISFKRPRRRGY